MEEQLKSNPAVLQCSNCLNIVGDTLSAAGLNDDTDSITLHSVTDAVDIGTKLLTLKKGSRKGTTYQRLACYHCSSILGRKYHTQLESKRKIPSRYTFKLDQLKIYRLGQFGSNQQNSNIDMSTSAATSTSSDIDIERLSGDVFKIKHLLLLLSQRVDRLEASTGIDVSS